MQRVNMDLLQVQSDPTFHASVDGWHKNRSSKGTTEKVVLSLYLLKINKRGRVQKRVLVVTNLAAYNFQKKRKGDYSKILRRMDLNHVTDIIRLAGKDDFILHMKNKMKHYHYRDPRCEKIAKTIAEATKGLSDGRALPIITLSETEAEAALKASTQKRRTSVSSHSKPDKSQVVPFASVRIMSRSRSMRFSKVEKELILLPRKGQGGTKLLMHQCKDFISRGEKGKEHAELLETWPQDSDEAIMRLCTEVAAGGSSGKGAAQAFAAHLLKNKAENEVVAAAAELFETFSAIPAPAPEHDNLPKKALRRLSGQFEVGLGRRYCLQYIWLVLYNTKQVEASSDKDAAELDVAEQFEAVVVKVLLDAIHKHNRPLNIPEFEALFEIVLDTVISPSAWEKGKHVKPFGRRIARAATIGTISQLIESADLKTRLLFMRSINEVLCRRVDENASALLENKFWSDWFWCIAVGLPKKQSDRSKDENELCKYFFNAYAILHGHCFSNIRTEPFDTTLLCTLNGLAMYNGWRPDGVNCARMLIDTFLHKLCGGVKTWKREYLKPQWENLFKLSAMIERFLFFQPAQLSDEASQKHGAPLLLTRSNASTKELKDTAGIHFDAETLDCLDINLVKRFIVLMKQLGYTGAQMQVDLSLTKQEAKRRNLANELTKDFGEIYKFLEKASKIKSLDEFTETVATFMESRSRKWSKIKLGNTKSKHSIQKIIKNHAFRSHAIRKIQVAHDEVAQVATQLEVETANAMAQSEPVAMPCTATKIADMVAQAEARARVSKVGSKELLLPEEKLCPACQVPVDQLDSTALSALGQWWHREHFNCHNCHKNLAVGPVIASVTDSKEDSKTQDSQLEFFARKDHPFCRECYLSLFASTVCKGCMKPVEKNQQVVKGCGYLWHTECFHCTKCKTDLCNVAFKNQDSKPYCKTCFSEEFLICPGCKGPIHDISDGFHAMGRNWHRNCFVCAHCTEPFSGEKYMAVDTGDGPKPYCQADYERLFVPICSECRKPVQKDAITAGNKVYHRKCLTCVVCKEQLDKYFTVDGKNYCEDHFLSECTRACAKCSKPCTGYYIEHNNLVYHEECFTCTVCGKGGEMYVVDNKPYCVDHYGEMSKSICAGCGETIAGIVREALGRKWHPKCLVCFECKRQLTDGKDNPDLMCCEGEDGHPYCMVHWASNFSKTCHKCKLPLSVHEKFVSARSGNVFHRQCFRCDLCNNGLLGTRSFEVKGYLYCEGCFHAQSSDRCPTCFQPVLRTDKYRMAFGKLYHWNCLQCFHCRKPFEEKQRFRRQNDNLYCGGCFIDVYAPSCAGCLKKIEKGYTKLMDKPWHVDCVKCTVCQIDMKGKIYKRQKYDWPVCLDHAKSVKKEDEDKLITRQKQWEEILKREQELRAIEESHKKELAEQFDPFNVAPPSEDDDDDDDDDTEDTEDSDSDFEDQTLLEMQRAAEREMQRKLTEDSLPPPPQKLTAIAESSPIDEEPLSPLTPTGPVSPPTPNIIDDMGSSSDEAFPPPPSPDTESPPPPPDDDDDDDDDYI